MADSKEQRITEKRLPPNAGKGRKKGVPNKVTRCVKEAVEAAFQKVGGEEYLVGQAVANPLAFMSLLGKLLPSGSQLNVAVGVAVEGGREPFEAIMARSLIIDGGLPDFEERKQRDIGQLYQRWAAGETLPEEIIVGGLPDPFRINGYVLEHDGPLPEGLTVSGPEHDFIAVPRKCETPEEWTRLANPPKE